MRMKVTLKFSDEERKAITEFASLVKLDVDTFCRQAVFFSINEGYRRANELQSRDNTAPRNTEGNSTEVSSSTGNSSAALPNQASESTSSQI